MKICIIGAGYVGLVAAACFAESGNSVIAVAVDETKIEGLKQGIIPIYEPGLKEMVLRNQAEGRLSFTTSCSEAVQKSLISFIAVGTPPGEDGSADLQYVLGVAREIGRAMTGYKIIVDKSTVPVGTADKVRAAVKEELEVRSLDLEFDVVSNAKIISLSRGLTRLTVATSATRGLKLRSMSATSRSRGVFGEYCASSKLRRPLLVAV